MTTDSPKETSETATVESITDPESLRDRDDVPFYENTNVADEEMLDVLDDLDDVAVVGITNEDGAVLLRKLTEDCSWKPPMIPVASDEEYAATARRTVAENTGLTVELDALEGVWRYEDRLEDGERTATRSFVVFSASPSPDEPDGTVDSIPEENDLAAGEWVDELPADADEPPGTRLFFD